MYAGMHVLLFPLRKFQLCANAVAPGKLRVGLKISDQSRAGSRFYSQNTHSHFHKSKAKAKQAENRPRPKPLCPSDIQLIKYVHLTNTNVSKDTNVSNADNSHFTRGRVLPVGQCTVRSSLITNTPFHRRY